MPAPFHPCRFNFDGVDLRRVGSTVSAGRSLAGYETVVMSDGGGYWQADFTDGETLDRETGLAWRAAVEAMDGGATAVDVLFCAERHFQPVLDREGGIAADDAPDKGAAYVTAASALLRATTLTVDGDSELPLEPGNLFSIQHPSWGWRVYRITEVDGATIKFRPPLREAVGGGIPLEMDTPRCQMVVAPGSSPTNPTAGLLYTACAISFVEDMSNPTT